MPKFILSLLVALLVLLPTVSNLHALENYGKALVLQGELTILRNHKPLIYNQAKESVVVKSGDVLRVGSNGLVELNSFEGAKIQIGSNGVFEVRPWKKSAKTGYMRMLFGRAKFSLTAKLRRMRPFRLKTATAVMGVKGTVWFVETNSYGETHAMTEQGQVFLIGNDGFERDLFKNMASMTVAGRRATLPMAAPKDLSSATKRSDTHAPPAQSRQATHLTSEKAYIAKGMIDPIALEQGRNPTVLFDEAVPPLKLVEPKEIDPIDDEFEKDLKDSEDVETFDLRIDAVTSIGTKDIDEMLSDEPSLEFKDIITGSQGKIGQVRIEFEY